MNIDDEINLKVVLVGDSGIGKTCIIKRYVDKQYSEGYITNRSCTYHSKTINYDNKIISLDIWDTAGQERYRAVVSKFFLNVAIGILVYDITRRDSFESIKNYWYGELKENEEKGLVIGVAANKCDLSDEQEVNEEEGRQFAESIDAIFRPTSAKENFGIDELFEECGKKYLNNIPNYNRRDKITIHSHQINKIKNGKRKCCLTK